MTSATNTITRPPDSLPPLVRWRRPVSLVLSIVVLAAVWFAPLGVSPRARHALAIAAFMVVSWITGTFPHAFTGLAGCCLFWLLGVVRFSAAFSGFADLTPWFLLGALLVGMAVTKSGLAKRLAQNLIRLTGASYSGILLGLILTSFLLTFLVPSGIACVAAMASVAGGIVQALGLRRGSSVGRGLFITLTYTAGCFDKMIVAGAASILGRGLIEKTAHIHIYWSLWLLAFLPCAIVTILVTWRLILWLYPPEKVALERAASIQSGLGESGPWSTLEKKTLVLTLVALALWMTDLLHHISPAVIGIAAGFLALLPRVGLLDRQDLKRLNYLPVLFVAAAISMGSVLVETNALSTVAIRMFDWMAPLMRNRFAFAVAPYWTAFAYHILLGNEIAMLAASLPPLLRFAGLNGFHALPLGLIWSFAAGGKIFAYQSGVMVAGYSYGYFQARDLLRVGLLLSILESLLLIAVVPYYWPLIGIR